MSIETSFPHVTTVAGSTGKTILATYKNADDANVALEALHQAGVTKDDISVMALDHTAKGELPGSEVGKASDAAATGAWQGAKLGLVGGLLVGVAAMTIPGLGPLLAVGPLAASLGVSGIAGTAVTGAGIGTAVGGIGALVSSLVKMGVPHKEAEAFHADLQGGGVLLSVKEHGNLDVLKALQAGHPTRVTTA
jgi:hypothetical protein